MKGLYLTLIALLFSSESFSNQDSYSKDELKALAKREQNVSHIPNFQEYLKQESAKENFKQYALDLNRDNYVTGASPLSKTTPNAPLPKVLVFTSLGLSDLTLKQQLQQSEQYKVPLIIRGILPSGFAPTAARINELLGLEYNGDKTRFKINSGFAVSPDWFKRFKIDAVPAVVVIKDGKCMPAQECKDSDYDIVRGNIPIPTALEMIRDSGHASSQAKTVLARGM